VVFLVLVLNGANKHEYLITRKIARCQDM